MKPLTLHSDVKSDYTLIPNYFFDSYMPKASGEFVKIYLYIVRCYSDSFVTCGSHMDDCEAYPGSGECFCISFLADKFNVTENDIMRALKYWESEGLLKLTYSGQAQGSELTGIILTDGSMPDAVTPEAAPAEAVPDDGVLAAALSTSAAAKPRKIYHKPSYTAAQLKDFSSDEELSQLLYIAQMYMGRTLNASETNSIIFFYDTLKLTPDVIEYLLEYCISRNHSSMRYIEATAIDWAENRISTVSDAKYYVSSRSDSVYTVLKAFGISGRNAARVECDYIVKWQDTYGFDSDIIVEACNRTIAATHQPSFEYADKILSKWKEHGINTVSDIKALDAEHSKAAKTSAVKTRTGTQAQSGKTKNSGNRFNNFSQRDYDYDELETCFVSRKLV